MSEPSILHGSSKWSCCAEAEGAIYCLPSHAGRILRITAEGGGELWGPDWGEETWKWTAAVKGPEGAIWGIPGNASRVLCISGGRAELVGPPMEGTHKWHAAVLAADGCIYAPPCDCGQVLRIDCGRRYVSLIGPILGGAGKYAASALAANGYIYCPPNHAASVLRISPNTKQVEMIGPDLRFGGGGAYVSAVTGADGNVYCPPFSATRVLRICDPEVELIGPEMDWMAHQWRCSVRSAVDECIYAVPCNASRVLKIDPGGSCCLVGPEFPCSPAPEGMEKWRSCCEVDGCIYAIPSHAKQILRIKTGAAALESLTFEQLEAQKLADAVAEENRLRAEAASRAQDGSSQEEDDDDEEENSDIEDVEEWPEEECDGVSLWGPTLGQRWTRKNKFRTALAGPSPEMLVAPPYHCGQLLAVNVAADCPPEQAVQLLGDAPAKPPKKVFIPLPDEDE